MNHLEKIDKILLWHGYSIQLEGGKFKTYKRNTFLHGM